MFKSVFIGLVVAIFIWVFSTYFLAQTPDIIFNLAGFLGIHGGIIVVLLTNIFKSEGTWQAMHFTSPYDCLSYLANFFFYFGFSAVILHQLRKRKEKRHKLNRQYN